jgi:hypothetical protein
VSFTYDITTTVGLIRKKIGDVLSTNADLTDEEINACYLEYPSIIGAAKEALRNILARYKALTDRSANGFSSSRSQRFQQCKDLLDKLESSIGSVADMTFTGASEAVKEEMEADTDFVRPGYVTGQDRNDTLGAPGIDDDGDEQ